MTDLIEQLHPLTAKIEQGLAQGIQGEQLIRSFIPEFKTLLSQKDWLPQQFQQEHPQHYQQYLLYLDTQSRFSIVSFVWGPNQTTPIHNHEVWGVVGVLQGAEISQRYQREHDHLIPVDPADVLNETDIDFFTPEQGDIHQVSNAFQDRVSISIHIYGADIGQVKRFSFDAEGRAKPFISGYSNQEFKS